MIEVKNGTRVPVEFVRAGRGYTGLAAVEHEDGRLVRVLFPARASDLRGVATGMVDGQPVRVIAASASVQVPSVLVVTVATNGAAE